MNDARFGLNDFRAIKQLGGDPPNRYQFTPQDALHEHLLSRAWLQQRLNAPVEKDVTTAVVTHRGPSSRSMDPLYEGSELNPCFFSELPESFFHSAVLWVHGNSHGSADYVHHRTRVVANPRGYVRRDGRLENENFERELVVELDAGARTPDSSPSGDLMRSDQAPK